MDSMFDKENVHGSQKTAAAASYHKSNSKSAHHWAAKFVQFNDSKEMTSRPWGSTHRLAAGDNRVYLKRVPSALAPALNAVQALSNRFPDHIPATLAVEPSAGWILTQEHGARDLAHNATEQDRIAVLTTYARIQAAAHTDSELLEHCSRFRADALLDKLLAFLNPNKSLPLDPEAPLNANSFFSKGRCQRYASNVSARIDLLRDLLKPLDELPVTVNHGDLRVQNAARRQNTTVLFDWDEVQCGPAGLSLHGMFSGALRIWQVLHVNPLFSNPEALRQSRRELQTYMSALVADGYSTQKVLTAALPATALAGMIEYIIGLGRFPIESSTLRRTVRKNIAKRLSDLLDVCDYGCLINNLDIMGYAQNYADNQRAHRAERLLINHLEQHPENGSAREMLAELLMARHHYVGARRQLLEAVELRPGNPHSHKRLGETLTHLGDFKAAKHQLRRSFHLAAKDTTRHQLEHVHRLEKALSDAGKPGTLPTVTLSPEERKRSTPDYDLPRLCEKLLRQHGVLLVRNLFEPSLLQSCHQDFLDRYRSYISNARHEDALRIGDKRFQVTIDFTAPYDSPSLYGHPFIVALMQRLLGKDCILGCFTSAMSLPGSKDQRVHKDHKALFFDDRREPAQVPSFAVTMMVPLVDTNELVGTTRVQKGSHLLKSKHSEALPWQTPFASVGDCYLMDYRLSHHGQANRSDQPRPILSLVYQRPWFRDYINFNQQPSLRITSSAFNAVPDPLKPLLSWTNEPGPR